MTKTEIKNAIATYENKIAAEKIVKMEIVEIMDTNGKDWAIPTGEYKIERREYPGENEKDYLNKIRELRAELDKMDEAKRKAAKIKRYEKELAELNDRKAYLEKWLAENK